MMTTNKPDFYAYSVPTNERSTKPWRMIGAAWNNNGYISILLDAYPTAGNKLVLGPPREPENQSQGDREQREEGERRDNTLPRRERRQ